MSSPSTEIAGDLAAVRMGVRQRWQTKRGSRASSVVDWMTFDTQGVVFPDPNRDNFGTAIGLVNYNYRWFLGDRTTVVSDGYLRLLRRRPEVHQPGHVSEPAAARLALHRRDAAQRPDSTAPCWPPVLQLSHEPQVDLDRWAARSP